MNLKNLTPHPITIVRRDGTTVTIAPEAIPARVSEQTTEMPVHAYDVPLLFTQAVGVIGLPPREPGVVLIVSRMVLDAADRADLVSPGTLVRDAQGRVTGCASLIVSSAFVREVTSNARAAWSSTEGAS